jgi:outer membrane protein assembly factor BamB
MQLPGRILTLTSVLLVAASTSLAANWPAWRGPAQDQSTPETHFPIHWSAKEGSVWKVALPAPGNSSPVVWENRVFITQATDEGRRRSLMCFDRADGKLLWQTGLDYALPESHHDANPHCAASPVTDGERVIASFGSAGVLACDMAGHQLWRTDLGPQKHDWGQGSSPTLFGDLCIVYHGPGPGSTLYALDKKTGKKQWQTPLPEAQPPERFDGFAGKSGGQIGTFGTPLVIHAEDRDQIILPVVNRLRAFSVKNGAELWSCAGMNPLVYSSPTYGEGELVAFGGFFGSAIFIKPSGDGDITPRRLYYEQRTKRHRIGSPVIYQGHVYFCNTVGVAECVELATGRTVWEERLPATASAGEIWGSMVRAGDLLYVVNQSGDTFVLKASPKFELIATNPVGELSNSTPALSRGQVFLRTHQSLWCFGQPPLNR